ncbi:MAG: WS/DGAT/MGAT family O-acyltransferase [Nostocoides sp.]
MTDRVSALDFSTLYLAEGNTPLHVGSVMIFEPTAGFDYDRLIHLVSARLVEIPRYRQRIVEVPGNLAPPVWVDDPAFDVSYHVRRSALPRPGTDEQLEEFVARITPRPLDLNRPLWEAYFIEGLYRGRFALVTKTHPALVDGVDALDLAQVLLSTDPTDSTRGVAEPVSWIPHRPPNSLELLVGAMGDLARSPRALADTVSRSVGDLASTAKRVAGAAGDIAGALARVSTRPAPTSPLNARVGGARRFVMVGTDLQDYRRVREQVTGPKTEEVTINDVVLATLAGALRTWLLTRGESVTVGTTVRAMVPVSIESPTEARPKVSDRHGHAIRAFFVDLPVGEPAASMRLHQIAFMMRQQLQVGRAVDAATLVAVGDFAPPGMYALASRVGQAVSRRLYNLAVTNVPGPQHPMYAAGAQLLASYPVMPLSPGQALTVGLTSYDGGVYYGLLVDRDAIPDVDVLGQAIVDSLTELLQIQDGTVEV